VLAQLRPLAEGPAVRLLADKGDPVGIQVLGDLAQPLSGTFKVTAS
jgi:hypothetical protein